MTARAARRDAPLRAALRVIGAVMLRDLRTRFFNHGLGFLISIGFPLVHVLILIAIWQIVGRSAPFGDSTFVFFGATLAPYMAWNYVSRFMMMSLLMNRPLLAFPAVTIVTILFGRAALEILGAACMVLVLFGVATALNVEVAPWDMVDASLAMAVSLLMGLGFGAVCALIAFVSHSWVTIYTLIQITLYLSSAIVFLPSDVPEWGRNILSWIPTLQIIEWMRVAFFENYPDDMLHRGYATAWALGSIAVGLGLERAIRGRLLEG
jgi:capsular polysaccharide transport system permease protein